MLQFIPNAITQTSTLSESFPSLYPQNNCLFATSQLATLPTCQHATSTVKHPVIHVQLLACTSSPSAPTFPPWRCGSFGPTKVPSSLFSAASILLSRRPAEASAGARVPSWAAAGGAWILGNLLPCCYCACTTMKCIPCPAIWLQERELRGLG